MCTSLDIGESVTKIVRTVRSLAARRTQHRRAQQRLTRTCAVRKQWTRESSSPMIARLNTVLMVNSAAVHVEPNLPPGTTCTSSAPHIRAVILINFNNFDKCRYFNTKRLLVEDSY
eukprot:4275374-Pyramimonas_sp.AAC.1